MTLQTPEHSPVGAPASAPLTLGRDQREVIDLPPAASGIVVGAAGTGKTESVIARVAALIDAGMSVDDILVLTPTRHTATALRDRLAVRVGVATRGPLARSITAFAFQVVRAAATHAGEPPPRLLTGPDEDRILADLLAGDAADEASGRLRWPEQVSAEIRDTPGFRSELRAFLAELHDLGITPDVLARRAEEEDQEIWRALASFATEYYRVRDGMRSAHRDAAGLTREAVGLLRTTPLGAGALAEADALRCVLVDDAQELTLGGIELLEALHSRGVTVLAFGDPDIGAGSFRGARPENFARLQRLGDTVVLRERYRGTTTQRALVDRATARIGAVGVVAHRQPPVAAPEDESVRAFVLRSPGEEVAAIARLLRERHLFDGVPWGGAP